MEADRPDSAAANLMEYFAEKKRFGRQCCKCRAYFVAAKPDEKECDWCKKRVLEDTSHSITDRFRAS